MCLVADTSGIALHISILIVWTASYVLNGPCGTGQSEMCRNCSPHLGIFTRVSKTVILQKTADQSSMAASRTCAKLAVTCFFKFKIDGVLCCVYVFKCIHSDKAGAIILYEYRFTYASLLLTEIGLSLLTSLADYHVS
jgi:hypothetical protein